MIILASRIATASGALALGAHVFSGPKNRSIAVVQGSRAELDGMVRDARAHGAKYAVRHYKVSPGEATTREDALAVVAALGREFGFDPGCGVLVEHEKRREGGQGFDRHWHLMVAEVDPVRGRVLDAHWMRARHEKVSRVAEIELGHHPVRGRWNRAVEAALRAEGHDALADGVHPLTTGDRPVAAYTSVQHQAAERRGVSLPGMRAVVADAWQRSDGAAAVHAALAEHGVATRPGDKKGVWVVEAIGADGAPVFLGSLHRLTRVRKLEVDARMTETPAPVEALAPAVTAEATPPVVAPTMPAPALADVAPSSVADVPGPPAGLPDPGPAAVAPQPIPAARPAPSLDGGRPASSHGGGGGGGTDPSAGIAAVDPNRPGDAARFLRQVADQQRQQNAAAAQAAARPSHLGVHHVQFRHDGPPGSASSLHWQPEERALEHEPPQGRAGRDLSTGAGPGSGSPGSVDGDVWGHEGRGGGRRAAPAAGSAGPEDDGRGVEDRHGDQPAAGNRGEPTPDGEDAVHARLATRQLELGLKARPYSVDRLQALILALDPLEQALAVSDERARAVLEDEPWADPASRDAKILANVERDRMDDERKAATQAVETARDIERSAMASLGIRDRLGGTTGIGTEAGRRARDAALETVRLQGDVKDLMWKHARRRERLDADASAIVAARDRERTRWNGSSAVQRARRELDGNQLVREAVADPRIRRMAPANLGKLRGKLLCLQEHEVSTVSVSARLDLETDVELDRSPTPTPGQ